MNFRAGPGFLVSRQTSTVSLARSILASGFIRPISGSDCSRTETFDVSGVLSDVDSSDDTYLDDAGSFHVALTHYRILWRTRCITYAATVKGEVTFTDVIRP